VEFLAVQVAAFVRDSSPGFYRGGYTTCGKIGHR
jgi:hypothetical protein